MADNIVLAKYKADVKDALKSIDQLDKKVNKLDKDTKKSSKDMQSSFTSAFSKIGAATGIAFGTQQLVSFGKEAVKVAAKAEGIERAFNKLNSPNLLNDLRKATRGTVSDLQLMQKAVQANNFKLPLDQLAKLFEFATNRAIETGESVDYLVESIVLGISRKSIPIMDNLGISSVALQNEMKKTGDFAQAAFNIIESEMESAGVVMDTTAVKLARLETAWANFTKEVGDSLIVLADFAMKLNDINGIVNLSESSLEDYVDKTASAALSSAKLSEATGEEVGWFKQLRIQLFGLTDEEEQLIQQQENLTKATQETTEAVDVKVNSINELNKQLKGLKDDLSNAEIGSNGFYNALDKITTKTKELNEAIAMTKLADALKVDDEEMPDISGGVINYTEEVERQTSIADDLWEAHFQKLMQQQDEAFENDKKNREAQIQLAYEGVNTIASIASSIYQIQQSSFIAEQQELEKQLEQGLITREKYDRELKEINQKQAQANKDAAIFQATISTAQAVVNALGSFPFSPANIALAAAIGAAGAAQIAAIASQPLPQFAEGGWVDADGKLVGRSHAQGGIKLEAEGGEYIVNKIQSKKHAELIESINSGSVEDYIAKKYIIPTVQQIDGQMSGMAASAALNSFNDMNLLRAFDRNRQSGNDNAKYIVSGVVNGLKQSRSRWN